MRDSRWEETQSCCVGQQQEELREEFAFVLAVLNGTCKFSWGSGSTQSGLCAPCKHGNEIQVMIRARITSIQQKC